MYNKKNVDFVALLWENFMFQADNREISFTRKEQMPYTRFTKVIISRFISKDKTISMRYRINLHTVRDDILLDIKNSKAYKTYLDFATRKATPMKARKFKKVASPSRKLSPVLEQEPVEKPNESMPKKKTPAKVVREKGIDLLFDVALLKVAQLKKTLKKSKLETHKLLACGSGTSTKPRVLDVPKYQSESGNESYGNSGDNYSNDDDSDEVTNDDDVDSDADGDKEASDSKKTNSDEDVNLNLNQNDDEEEEY
nr:hypothetical protein [Tanacetum cinerariifolium]